MIASDCAAKASRGPVGPPPSTAQASDLCPLCGTVAQGLFHTDGLTRRPRARCRSCRSLERHRLVWTYFVLQTDLFGGRRKRVLHLAPERVIRERLERHPRIDYVSADLDPLKAMVATDITDIQYPDSSFDVVYCSHVLEHVPDDRKAMSEVLRVLCPGGWAILAVPMRQGTTYENFSITRPEERQRHFAQRDHVRWYGRADFPDRLRSVGFEVDVDPFPRRELGERLAARMGIRIGDRVHFCRKPQDREHRPPAVARPALQGQADWTALEPPSIGGWVPERKVSAVVTVPPGRPGDALLALAGLSEQTYPHRLIQVVLAGDRASEIELPEAVTSLGVTRVRAPGPRARAAGAAAADGELLVFLDGQLVPDPRYVEAHARWHHVATDAVTLGTRRYADPEGLLAEDVRAAAGSGSLAALFGARERWPTEEIWELVLPPDQLAHEPSELLGSVARGTYALSADMLAAVGGRLVDGSNPTADEELGNRLLERGALLVPERRAIAWHMDERAATAERLETRAPPDPSPDVVSPPSAGPFHQALYRAKLRALRPVARRSPAAARNLDRLSGLLTRRGGGR